MSDDFDEFMKEADGSPEPSQEDIFELEMSDNKDKRRTLVDQIKEAIKFTGTDTDVEILRITCEEFLEVCKREVKNLQDQIDECKAIQRTKIEQEAKGDENPKTEIDKAPKK